MRLPPRQIDPLLLQQQQRRTPHLRLRGIRESQEIRQELLALQSGPAGVVRGRWDDGEVADGRLGGGSPEMRGVVVVQGGVEAGAEVHARDESASGHERPRQRVGLAESRVGVDDGAGGKRVGGGVARAEVAFGVETAVRRVVEGCKRHRLAWGEDVVGRVVVGAIGKSAVDPVIERGVLCQVEGDGGSGRRAAEFLDATGNFGVVEVREADGFGVDFKGV